MKRAFVLLSGGVDSTTCLYLADKEFEGQVEAISVDYGQRHRKEFEYAARSCEGLGLKHSVLSLRGILEGEGVMLTDAKVAIPNISYSDIQGVSPTYVPNRNMTLLSLIVAHAQKWVNKQIAAEQMPGDDPMVWRDIATKAMKDSVGVYFGAHSEDAFNWAYPDCTPEFIGSMKNAIYTATYYAVRLHTPLEWFGKEEIIRLGQRLGVVWENTWSCYAGGGLHCGTCPTCRARREGFRKAGVKDPTVYDADYTIGAA
jgi:7-cyano-7-deazaguanine synthase